MDPRTTKNILARLTKLERESVRLRKGRVIDDSPLTIDLGESGVPYTDIPHVIGRTLNVNDVVAALVSGNNVLTLGKILGNQMQLGTASINCTITGQQAVNFTVGPWLTHYFTAAFIIGVATSWPTIRGCVTNGLSGATVVLDSPTIQVVTIGYLSFGDR